MALLDQAIEILQKTNDGNSLTPQDLHLVQCACNGPLTELGEVAFAELHSRVASGEYAKAPHWFHGIENLTIDHEGYVYWKGRQVEHYSFDDVDREKASAQKLAAKCLKLESIDFPVTGRTVLSEVCLNAEKGTPWRDALQRYYTFFEKDGHFAGIFHRKSTESDDSEAVIMYLDKGEQRATLVSTAYDAYHSMQGNGYVSTGYLSDYSKVLKLLEAVVANPATLATHIGIAA
jgi:hypothetical protein